MNKLKQLYKALLTRWNDNSFYKTSLTKNNTIFKTRLVMVLFSIIGVVGVLLQNWVGATLCYMVTSCAAALLSAMYKEVADDVGSIVEKRRITYEICINGYR